MEIGVPIAATTTLVPSTSLRGELRKDINLLGKTTKLSCHTPNPYLLRSHRRTFHIRLLSSNSIALNPPVMLRDRSKASKIFAMSPSIDTHFCIQQPNETCNSLTWLIMVQYILEMWPVSFLLLEREDLHGLPPELQNLSQGSNYNCKSKFSNSATPTSRNLAMNKPCGNPCSVRRTKSLVS